MRLALAWLLLGVMACQEPEERAAYAPSGTSDGMRDGGSRAVRPGSTGSQSASSEPDPADGGVDAALPAAESVSPGTMLAQVTVATADGDRCALQSVSPGPSARTAPFECEHHGHAFRRSDGARFYVSRGRVYAAETGEELPTECEVFGHVDFDAEDRMHYRCAGGTTGPLFRDDELVIDGLVAEFGGVLDDGRILYQGFEDYRVLDRLGLEIDAFPKPEGYTALEEATAVVGNEALVLHAGENADGEQEYVVTRYGDVGFTEVARMPAVEPPPSNQGYGHQLDAEGALYVALDDQVRRYDPSGGSAIVWSGTTTVTLARFDELVYFGDR